MLLGYIAAAIAGCAHSAAAPPDPAIPTDISLSEAACENNLLHLAMIIEELTAKKGSMDAKLVEATEIYRLAESLYLQQQYDIASQLIEDAIDLLEEPGE